MNLKPAVISAACLLLLLPLAFARQADKIIQINIGRLLNARPVTILAGNKLISWAAGIDGGGTGDGYLTRAAALYNSDKNAHALPDEALIPATDLHPPVLLHYKNGDAGYQAYNLAGPGSFQFKVPCKKYRGLYLTLTSAEGPSQLHIRLTYRDGVQTKDFTLPDYYNDIAAGDTTLSYALHNLAKWGSKNNMTESDHHNIDVLNIHPDAGRMLKSISVTKDKEGYLVFWAATGIAE